MSRRKNKQNRKQARNKQVNNSFDRTEIGHTGLRTQGELRRGRALRADHKRNIAEQFGYPDTISLRQHYDMAHRNGIGGNLAFGIVNDTWRVPPVIYDGPEDAERRKENPTEFEKAWDELTERLEVWNRLKSLDLKQRPMRYGGMMFVTSGEAPGTDTTNELLRLPSIEYLIGLRTYHEAQLPVQTAVDDAMRIDYGRPLTYQIRTNAAGSTNEWENKGPQVHASRIFAYGEGALDGSIYGEPCNEAAFEALMDLAKARGSSSEGVFQNASNKYVNLLPKEASAADAVEILESQEDFDNDIGRSMVAVGDVKTLQTQMTGNPKLPWEMAFAEACASHSKPQAVVMGEITGERASTENLKSWNRIIMDRQKGPGNDMITGFLKEVTEKFTFPAPKDKINIVWRDLNESTAEQQVDLAKKRAETNKICVESRMQPIYSTEYIQAEAGAPTEKVIVLDDGGEGDENDI
jgi:hypothetical protein